MALCWIKMRVFIFTEKMRRIINLMSTIIFVLTISGLFVFLYWRTEDENSLENKLLKFLREFSINTVGISAGSVAGASYFSSIHSMASNNLLSSLLPGLPLAARKINEEVSELLKNVPETQAGSFSDSDSLYFYSALLIPFGGLIMYRMLAER